MPRYLLGILLVFSAGPALSAGPETLSLSGGTVFRGARLSLSALEDFPPPASVRGSARAARPAWLIVEGAGDDFAKAEQRLLEAAAIVGETPTGKELAKTLTQGKGRVFLRENGSFYVSDRDNAVVAGPGFVNSHTPRALAALFAHELEHLVQGQAGVKGSKARGARELGAFLVQCRVWVEAGAPVDDNDWKANSANSQDMWAWLEYPYTSVAVLKLRGDLIFDLSQKEVGAYWNKVLEDDAQWRRRWGFRFPGDRDSREAALFILRQAARFAPDGVVGEVSSWLPAHLENMRGFSALSLPDGATEMDRAYVEALRPVVSPR